MHEGTGRVRRVAAADLALAAVGAVAAQVLGGLDRPDDGRVVVDDKDIHALPERARAMFRAHTIGFVFQFHHLLPDFTAVENVMMPALIAGRGRKEARERACGLLEAVGLEERLHHRPAQLSGGEQQRVAVARALMNEPRLLLADEPSGNLDPANARALEGLLWDLVRRTGTTLVIVTHDHDLAARADHCLRLSGGTVEEVSLGRDV